MLNEWSDRQPPEPKRPLWCHVESWVVGLLVVGGAITFVIDFVSLLLRLIRSG